MYLINFVQKINTIFTCGYIVGMIPSASYHTMLYRGVIRFIVL